MRAALVVIALVASAGCGSRSPAQPLDNVKQTLADRLPQTIHWNDGGAEDAAAAEAVRELLMHELTADDAVQIALLNDASLQAVYTELGVRQADLVQAGLLSNPVFAGELRFSSAGTAVEMSLVQNFISILQIPLRKRLAALDLAAAEARVAAAVIDRAADARIGFYDAQAATQALELRQSIAEATAASALLAERLHAAGNITDLDLASERALAQEAKLDLGSAELRLIETRERLTVQMGLWGADTEWRAVSRLDEIAETEAIDAVEQRAVAASLELLRLRHEIDLAGQTWRATRPLLADAEVGVAAERETDGEWGVGPALSIPVPLFDTGRPAVDSAIARYRGAHHRYTSAAVAIRSMARTARARVMATAAQARYVREVLLPTRQTVTTESQKQFNAMTISGFQLLDAKREEIEAGERYLAVLRDHWVARARLEQLLDGGMPAMDLGMDPPASDSSDGRAQH